MIGLLEVAFDAVKKYGFMGIRCSTRPDKIDTEVLSILKSFGVTSIELGAQSMDDEVLLANDRGHNSEDVRIASKLIKDYGFSLGLQMMTGLYKSSEELDIKTANELIKLKPDTVRIYPTVTLENTRLADLYRSGDYIPMDLDSTIKLCSNLLDMFDRENIKVIRLGLHASEEVEEKRLAGAYHPALREMCESEVLLNKLKTLEKGEYEALVNPKYISKFVGQKRKNIETLKNMGIHIKISQTSEIKDYKIIERIGEFKEI